MIAIMSRQRLKGGLITLCLLLTCRLAGAVGPPGTTTPSSEATSTPVPAVPVTPATPSSGFYSPINPATVQPGDLSLPGTPANNGSLGVDAGTNKRFYTLTASLREIYDDNVNTTSSNPQASEETELSPSILVDFRRENSDFSARYTLNLTYYTVGPNDNGASNGSSANGAGHGSAVQYTQNFTAQYMHAFSDRFILNLAEQFQYETQPSLLESTGTNYQNGPYVSNSLNGTVSTQLTPLLGTLTSFANTIVQYEDSGVATNQNSVEDTGTETVSYAILPKISASAGLILDNIVYEMADRGYTTYTAFGGGQWEALPSLTLTLHAGATYIEPAVGQASIAPYGALSVNWSLGARSMLSFDYAHEITPSDQVGANGQTSDRFSSSFRYDITPRVSASLAGIFTSATVSSGLAVSGAAIGYQEDTYEVDPELTFHYNSYLDFDTGITVSGVSTTSTANSYSRNEAFVGVRGTY
jgi:hypothetical protein